MLRRTLMICWLIFAVGICLTSSQPVLASQKQLQGSWVATKAEREGKAAADLLGHRLSFSGNRFEIVSKDGKMLFAGTFRVGPKAKAASIDFAHQQGALKGKAWKGIYALSGEMLTICDNAEDLKKGRPTSLEAKAGSGYVLLTFGRSKG